jgi:hypothetical protein
VSDDERGRWPVLPSEIVGDTLSDPDILDPDWQDVLIPDGHGIAGGLIPKPSSRSALS